MYSYHDAILGYDRSAIAATLKTRRAFFKMFKVGGLLFFRIGSFGGSFYISRVR